MRELDDVLAEAARGREQSLDALRPGAGRLAATVAGVRRRRTRRHLIEAAVTVPLVAALVLGGWVLGGSRLGTLPPVDGPIATADLTVAPTVPGLPDRYLMPDGLLQRTGPGWVLATYAAPDPDQPDQNLDAVLLVSPDDVAFQVALLHHAALVDPKRPPTYDAEMTIDSWAPGTTTARVQVLTYSASNPGNEATRPLTLDLLTGELGNVASDLPDGAVPLGNAGSTPMWASDSTPSTLVLGTPGGPVDTGVVGPDRIVLSPDAQHVLVRGAVVDVATGAVVGTVPHHGLDGYCVPLGWQDAAALLLECLDQDPATARPGDAPSGRLVAAPFDGLDEPGTVLSDLRSTVLNAHSAARLTQGAVAVTGGADDGEGVYGPAVFVVRPDGTLERFGLADPRPDVMTVIVRAGGGRFVVATEVIVPGSGQTSAQLTAYDADVGSPQVLLAPPAADPALVDHSRPVGVTSWILAP